MIVLITLIYLGCVYAAFKVIKLEVKPASVAIAAMIGIYVLGGVIISWNFAAPMVDKMTVTRAVIPLLASQNTKEAITKIHVAREQSVKKGDLLFEVETAPSQYMVDRRTAELEEARKNLASLTLSGPTAETQGRHPDALYELEQKVNELQGELGRASARYRSSISHINADALESALTDDTVMVDFMTFREGDQKKLMAGVVRKIGGETSYELVVYGQLDVIEKAVQDYREIIQDEGADEEGRDGDDGCGRQEDEGTAAPRQVDLLFDEIGCEVGHHGHDAACDPELDGER